LHVNSPAIIINGKLYWNINALLVNYTESLEVLINYNNISLGKSLGI